MLRFRIEEIQNKVFEFGRSLRFSRKLECRERQEVQIVRFVLLSSNNCVELVVQIPKGW